MGGEEVLVGAPLPRQRVIVERSAVQRFATALCEQDAVYFDADAARAAGFDRIPAPPTFAFVMATWGAFRELQEPGAGAKDPAFQALQQRRAQSGGTILHGEQEFEYHRPIEVGDELLGEGSVVDVYERPSGDRVMTFCVSETRWTDATSGAPVVTTRSTLIHRSGAGAAASHAHEERER